LKLATIKITAKEKIIDVVFLDAGAVKN